MIENAKIMDTMLGFDEHGIATFNLQFELELGCIGYGGYVLYSPGVNGKCTGSAFGCTAIFELLQVVGIDSWEQLKGKYCRLDIEEGRGPVKRIGNLVKDRWYDLGEIFERTRSAI